jgi:hypothetical protein
MQLYQMYQLTMFSKLWTSSMQRAVCGPLLLSALLELFLQLHRCRMMDCRYLPAATVRHICDDASDCKGLVCGERDGVWEGRDVLLLLLLLLIADALRR